MRKSSKRAKKPHNPHVVGMTLYWHPKGHKSFKVFAAENSRPGAHCNIHLCVMEAIEEYAAKRGIQGPFRTVPGAHAQ